MIYILVVQVRVQQYDSIYGVACGVRCSILLDTLEPLHLSPGRLGQASTQCRRPKREREVYYRGTSGASGQYIITTVITLHHFI